MPPRASWKGFLRLSLVSVPVKAYTANVTGAEIRLNQLHRKTLNRIRYVKTDPDVGEVRSEDIVSGYEYAKGQYVLVDPEEVQKLRPKGDQSVRIEGFFPPEEIDPIYLAGKTYFLVPDGPVGQKPYELLRRGMVEEGVHALAQVVLSGREQLVRLRPLDRLLVMSVLHYDAKVKKPESFHDELADVELTAEELALARTLIEASTVDDLDFGSRKDEYVEKLTQVIQAKVEGQEIVEVPDREEPKIINLMEALKASVAAARGDESAETAETAKTAGSAAGDSGGKKKKAGRKKAVSSKKAATGKKAAPRKKMAPSARGASSRRKKKSG